MAGANTSFSVQQCEKSWSLVYDCFFVVVGYVSDGICLGLLVWFMSFGTWGHVVGLVEQAREGMKRGRACACEFVRQNREGHCGGGRRGRNEESPA